MDDGPNYYAPDPDPSDDEDPWITPNIIDVSKVPQRYLRKHWSQNSETWTTRDGQVIPITEMTDSHLWNLMRYLMRNMASAKAQFEFWMIDQDSGPFGPRGDMAMDASNDAFDALMKMSNTEWLLSTPLWKALDAEYKKRKKGAR